MTPDQLQRITNIKNKDPELLRAIQSQNLINQLKKLPKTLGSLEANLSIDPEKIQKDVDEAIASSMAVAFKKEKGQLQDLLKRFKSKAFKDELVNNVVKKIPKPRDGGDGDPGKDGEVTQEHIDQITQTVTAIITDSLDLPTEITTNAQSIRNALELLQEGERLKKEYIQGLDDYEEIKERVVKLEKRKSAQGGGGLKEKRVLQLIEENAGSGGGGGGAGVTDGDKGDITVSGSGSTWTIDSDVVTYEKMQDTTASDIFLGRDTAGAGTIEEISASAARTILNVVDGATANSSDATLLDRANHTGTQAASTISDFDTEVSNNTEVVANTTARHDAVTVADSSEIDLTLTGQQISASIVAGSIDETKLDISVNASLDLADSALQAADIADFETTTQLNSRDTANRSRANHTGTQTASTISDFDTEVSNNTSVAANTAKVGVTTQISNVVEDTTPQLGGNLDIQTNKIVGNAGTKGISIASDGQVSLETDKIELNTIDVEYVNTAVTLNVPADFSTVQDALDSLSMTLFGPSGSATITVANGTYTLTDTIICNHPQGNMITIDGANPSTTLRTDFVGTESTDETMLRADFNVIFETSGFDAFELGDNGINISDCLFVNTGSGTVYGCRGRVSKSGTVTRCAFHNYSIGIFLEQSCVLRATDSIVSHSSNRGILVDNMSVLVFDGGLVGHSFGVGTGIQANGGSRVDANSSDIFDNSNHGIFMEYGCSGVFTLCGIYDNGGRGVFGRGLNIYMNTCTWEGNTSFALDLDLSNVRVGVATVGASDSTTQKTMQVFNNSLMFESGTHVNTPVFSPAAGAGAGNNSSYTE